jgi:FkbM family methyltransferase
MAMNQTVSGNSTMNRLDSLLDKEAAHVAEWERSAFDEEAGSFGKSLVLFGAGNLGRRILARLRQDGVEPVAFADNSPALWGQTVDGIHVFSPAEATRRYASSAAFVVTIWNTAQRFVSTRQTLTSLGCVKVLPVSKLRWKYQESFLPFFWEDLPHKLFEQKEAIRTAYSLWGDAFSRSEFLAQICWRTQGDFDGLHPPVREESYFPDDLFSLSPDEHFVDCGAYDGCTIRSFLQRSGPAFRRINGLEPDPENCRKLRAYVAGLPREIQSRCVVIEGAVGAKRETVRFDASGTMGSAITPQGSIEVSCAPLDELVGDEAPSYVKMDIEGAEPDALIGAERIIRKHHPILAVCLYHRPEHLWELPLLIDRLGEDYRLFLRPHEFDGWQLVCYAVPTARLRAEAST